MVMAFKKRSENTKDPVSEGLHLYVTSNLNDMNNRSKQGDSWSFRNLRKPIALQLKNSLELSHTKFSFSTHIRAI